MEPKLKILIEDLGLARMMVQNAKDLTAKCGIGRESSGLFISAEMDLSKAIDRLLRYAMDKEIIKNDSKGAGAHESIIR